MGKKRVVILTDSLGCPRPETSVDDTWVDRILKQDFKNCFFYTYCRHGAHSLNIPRIDIAALNPDIIVIQLGIVDACRRVMSERTEKIIRRIPIVRNIIHTIARKYHFVLTRIFNIHYSSTIEYKKMFEFFLNKTNSKIIFCAIAPAGANLQNKVFNVDDDIKSYNHTVQSLKNDRIIILDPWRNQKDFLLVDGHHLNEKGIELVFSSIYNELKESKL